VRWIEGGRTLVTVPHVFEPPEPATRIVMVWAMGAKPQLLQHAPEPAFVATEHANWPETKDLVLPSDQPRLSDRVQGPDGTVVGRRVQWIDNLLLHRRLVILASGRDGSSATRTVCATSLEARPTALSPDGNVVSLDLNGSAYLLDIRPGHGLVQLLSGRVLDWQG
jgi:hypothetical protein